MRAKNRLKYTTALISAGICAAMSLPALPVLAEDDSQMAGDEIQEEITILTAEDFIQQFLCFRQEYDASILDAQWIKDEQTGESYRYLPFENIDESNSASLLASKEVFNCLNPSVQEEIQEWIAENYPLYEGYEGLLAAAYALIPAEEDNAEEPQELEEIQIEADEDNLQASEMPELAGEIVSGLLSVPVMQPAETGKEQSPSDLDPAENSDGAEDPVEADAAASKEEQTGQETGEAVSADSHEDQDPGTGEKTADDSRTEDGLETDKTASTGADDAASTQDESETADPSGSEKEETASDQNEENSSQTNESTEDSANTDTEEQTALEEVEDFVQTEPAVASLEAGTQPQENAQSEDAVVQSFISTYLYDGDSMIVSANKDNYTSILSGLSAWNQMSTAQRAAVNSWLRASAGISFPALFSQAQKIKSELASSGQNRPGSSSSISTASQSNVGLFAASAGAALMGAFLLMFALKKSGKKKK